MLRFVRSTSISNDGRPKEEIVADALAIPFCDSVHYDLNRNILTVRWGVNTMNNAIVGPGKTLVVLPQDTYLIMSEDECLEVMVYADGMSTEHKEGNKNG